MATRIVNARAVTPCAVCGKNIEKQTLTSFRPGYGWVHHPKCVAATPTSPGAAALAGVKDTSDKWDDLEDDSEPHRDPMQDDEDDTSRAVRKGLGLPAQTSEPDADTDAIEARLFAELKRSLSDQTRLVKSMVKGELKEAFDETLPALLSKITTATKEATSELLKVKLEEARREFKTETTRAIARIANSGLVRQEVVIRRADGTSTELKGEVFHPDFDWICQLASAGKPIYLPGPTGCFAKGTKVLMFDGTTKSVEDVQVGEKLMGPDSKARTVLSLARGREMMYRVTPVKGDSYTVNRSHILSLKMSPQENGDTPYLVNITVADYLERSKWFKQQAKGWRCGVDFPARSVAIDPYFIGLWLGDGTTLTPEIATKDKECVDAVHDTAKQWGMYVTEIYCKSCNRYRISCGVEGRNAENPLLAKMREIGLTSGKFIPQDYRINSFEVRAQVLAGLVDSDGHMGDNGFEIISKIERLANDIAFLARSLGLAAYVSSKKITHASGEVGDYYRVGISGDCSIVPVRLSRKKAGERLQKKSALVTGITVDEVEEGDYFGFAVDGDHLFMLADFTVVHNCGKTHLASQLARALHGDKWQDKFSILSCSPATAERHFLGRSIPNITNGQDIYRAAEFVNRYENGGVFCADEIDAADASVLLVFNAALANGYLPLPDRTDSPIARKHPDFVFIGCANTWGRGADRMYVGRNRLDEATLDRFRIGTVPLDYSPAIERAKCPDTDLFDTLAMWRKKIYDNRLERVLSTRFFGDAYDMLATGAPMWRITKSFFGGWRDDEVRKVLGRTLEEEIAISA